MFGVNLEEFELFVYENKGEVASTLIDKRIAVVAMTLSEAERQYKVEK